MGDTAWRTTHLCSCSRSFSGTIGNQDGSNGRQSAFTKASPFHSSLWPNSLKLISVSTHLDHLDHHLCPISWSCTFATRIDSMQDNSRVPELCYGSRRWAVLLLPPAPPIPDPKAPCLLHPHPAHLWGKTQPPGPDGIVVGITPGCATSALARTCVFREADGQR